MKHKPCGEYPDNWNEIASTSKVKFNYCCERCGHKDDYESGYVLTVHHLDSDKSNCKEWNLAVLCQRCHLTIQGKVNMFQFYMFTHSDWFKPHVEGFYNEMHRLSV